MNDKNGKLIVISNAMLKSIPELLNVDKSQVVLVHNGIDWEDNNLISSQKRENGIHCVICGRIIRAKGHMEAVEALNILKNKLYQQRIYSCCRRYLRRKQRVFGVS